MTQSDCIKISLAIIGAALLPIGVSAQSAMDALQFSNSDINGTARFMSMGGAFGALGGDLSSLSQNPAGIGVYRRSEIGVTLGLDSQRANASSMGSTTDVNQTKFLFNNVGGVAAFSLGSETVPYINIGFTYNRSASFDRKYRGKIPRLGNSLSNLIAGIANTNYITDSEIENAGAYSIGLPWLPILGYDGYLIYPTGDAEVPHWIGQWNQQTTGYGQFDIEEKGGINDFNIAIGGNVNNTLYWGMNFGISSLSYTQMSSWGETLENATIDKTFIDPDTAVPTLVSGNADWTLSNYYKATGTGFNYMLGVIVKPIQEFRLGFAFHTPTWYSINEQYSAGIMTKYGNEPKYTYDYTNNGIDGYNSYNLRTPWRFIASAAGVIGNSFILSVDYEWASYGSMKFSEYNDYGYSYDWDDWSAVSGVASRSIYGFAFSDPYYDTNNDIKEYCKTESTIRVGAEYRVIPEFSLRAGFAYTDSPVKASVRDNRHTVYTAGTISNYTLDDHKIYLSFGVGYRHQSFYADLAYQYKETKSTYHAYTPDPDNPGIQSPQSSLKLENNRVVLSMGFKF